MSLVDEWILNLTRLGVMLDQREQTAQSTAQSSAWERDAALQLKAGSIR